MLPFFDVLTTSLQQRHRRLEIKEHQRFKCTPFLRKEKLKNEIWFYVVCVSALNSGGTH